MCMTVWNGGKTAAPGPAASTAAAPAAAPGLWEGSVVSVPTPPLHRRSFLIDELATPSSGPAPAGILTGSPGGAQGARPWVLQTDGMHLDRRSPSLLKSASCADLDTTPRATTPPNPAPLPQSTRCVPTVPVALFSPTVGSCFPPPRLDPPTVPHTTSFGTPVSTPDALLDLSKDCLTTPESTHLTSTVQLNALKHKRGKGSMVSRSYDKGTMNIDQSTLDMMKRFDTQLSRLHAKLDSPESPALLPMGIGAGVPACFGEAPTPRARSPVRYRIMLALSSIAACFLSIALRGSSHVRSRLSRAAVALALSCLVVKPGTAVKFATSLLPVLAISCASASNFSAVLTAALSALSYLSVLDDL